MPQTSDAGAVCFNPPKGNMSIKSYRAGRPDQTGSASSMPVLIGAAMIAAAILLSTLITALGSRYVAWRVQPRKAPG